MYVCTIIISIIMYMTLHQYMYIHVLTCTCIYTMSIKAVDYIYYTCQLYMYIPMYMYIHIKNYIHVYLWGTAAVDVPVLCDCHLTSPDRVRVPPDPRMVLGGQI